MAELMAKDVFLQSLDRCATNEGFLKKFYDRFLASSEVIRHKFRHTDFEQQHVMLLRSLKLSAGATAGDPEALHELRERAESHDRHHLNIEPVLYENWLSCVVKTAEEFDSQWNDSVKAAWHIVLGHVTHHMAHFY